MWCICREFFERKMRTAHTSRKWWESEIVGDVEPIPVANDRSGRVSTTAEGGAFGIGSVGKSTGGLVGSYAINTSTRTEIDASARIGCVSIDVINAKPPIEGLSLILA